MKLPPLMAPRTPPAEKVYKPAPHFDFATGEFLFDGAGRPIIADGHEAFCQWCIKTCMTERGSRLAYSTDIGTEFEAAMKEPEIDAVESSIIRTITETILVNPVAEYVKNFSFEMEGDQLKVSFTVKGKPWAEEKILSVNF